MFRNEITIQNLPLETDSGGRLSKKRRQRLSDKVTRRPKLQGPLETHQPIVLKPKSSRDRGVVPSKIRLFFTKKNEPKVCLGTRERESYQLDIKW